MNSVAKKVSRFGILTALALILGYLDRSIPVSAFLGGAVPGIKLGLANTVLLYALYLTDAKSCILLMLTKVILSGFLFGSLNAMIYSFAGGVLSLAVMMAVKRKPSWAALSVFLICSVSAGIIMRKYSVLRGQVLWCTILIASAGMIALILYFPMRKSEKLGVIGTSLAGAVAHNTGQILIASWMLKTYQLVFSYLPFLAGIGAVVGCLTGIIAWQVFQACRHLPAMQD